MAEKNHHHIFRHIGGGCDVTAPTENTPENPCDDHYRCSCGLEFRIYTTPEVHFTLPSEIKGRK